MPTKTHNFGGSYVPGRSMGGGTSPGHTMRNAYSNPTYYHGGVGSVQGGLNLGPAKPANNQNWSKFQFQMPKMDTSGSLFGAMGLDEPPAPPTPHLSSSIPLEQMQKQFLPQNVVDTGVNQQTGKMLQAANPQPMYEQYGATAGNMASATSGQYAPIVMSQMQDPMQEAAMTRGMVPAQAAQQRYQFGTQGHQAQANEVSKLANTANQNYSDRLSAYQSQLNQQQQMLAMMYRS